MRITFSSIVMAVFFSGILAGVLWGMRKRSYFIKTFDIRCMVLVYLFCILRMLLPIDFSFTQGIPIRGIFSDIYDVLCLKQYVVLDYAFTISDMFLGIWLSGYMALLLRFVYEYRKTDRILLTAAVRSDEQCMMTLNKVYETKGKARKVTILTNGEIQMPVGIGIWNRKILLPDQNYTNQELYYILLHEYTHFLNGDLVVKVLTHIFCCIFWWNPLVYFLKKDLDKSLEIKCDLCITENLAVSEASEYLETIVSTLKSSGERKRFSYLNRAAALADNQDDELVERFRMVLKNQKSKSRSGRGIAVWLAVVCIVWAGSYSFLPLPSYEAPIEEIEDEPGSFAITPDNSYVLIKNGKCYWVVEGYPDEEITEEEAKELEYDGLEIRGQ